MLHAFPPNIWIQQSNTMGPFKEPLDLQLMEQLCCSIKVQSRISASQLAFLSSKATIARTPCIWWNAVWLSSKEELHFREPRDSKVYIVWFGRKKDQVQQLLPSSRSKDLLQFDKFLRSNRGNCSEGIPHIGSWGIFQEKICSGSKYCVCDYGFHLLQFCNSFLMCYVAILKNCSKLVSVALLGATKPRISFSPPKYLATVMLCDC